MRTVFFKLINIEGAALFYNEWDYDCFLKELTFACYYLYNYHIPLIINTDGG